MAAAHVDRLSRYALREHQAKTVDVGFRRHVAAEEPKLLRRNIVELAGKAGADDGPVIVFGRARDAEIDDLRETEVAAGDQHVVRREIAVNDAMPVRGIQSARQALLQIAYGVKRQRALLEQVGKRFAIDELHREIVPPGAGIQRKYVIANDGVVVNVVQRRCFLAEEGERHRVVGKIRPHHLDGHHVAGFDGAAAVDFSHAPRGDVRLDFKYAVQPGAGGQAPARSIWGIHVGHVGLSPGGAWRRG